MRNERGRGVACYQKDQVNKGDPGWPDIRRYLHPHRHTTTPSPTLHFAANISFLTLFIDLIFGDFRIL